MATKKTPPKTKTKKTKKEFEPRIVVFACNWCSYPAADNAGLARMQYPPNIRIIRVMCGGRVSPAFVLKAFELGADGVLVSTCHFQDCHYIFGAKRAAENYERLENVVKLLGLEKERMRLEWISAAEATKFAKVIREMVAEVKKVGPTPIKPNGKLEILPDKIGDPNEHVCSAEKVPS
jgi:F420-non-reducing hydrogenase iron-sulfur subunit